MDFRYSIAIVCSLVFFVILRQLLLSRHNYHTLATDIQPLLKTLSSYFENIIAVCENKIEIDILTQEKNNIKNILASFKAYPEWVFALGFNPFLRGGFRFFLIKLELLTEYVFSLDYLFRKLQTLAQFKNLQGLFLTSLTQNKQLLDILYAEMRQEDIAYDPLNNYISDIRLLEESVFSLLPQHVELFDLTQENSYLIDFARHIKDMRKLLLELTAALPK